MLRQNIQSALLKLLMEKKKKRILVWIFTSLLYGQFCLAFSEQIHSLRLGRELALLLWDCCGCALARIRRYVCISFKKRHGAGGRKNY